MATSVDGRNTVEPILINNTRYRAGDTIYVKRREAVFLGMWGGCCYYSFVDKEKVRYSHRGFFKANVTS